MEGFYILLLMFTLIVLLIFMLILLFKAIKKNRIKSELTKKETKVVNQVPLENSQTKNFDTRIGGKMYQLIESIDLIMTSKNRDIVTARYKFAFELMSDIKIFKFNNTYKADIYETVEQYKLAYYDKIVKKEQLYFLQYPEDFELLSELYIRELSRCFTDYSQMQQEAINNMVQVKAKINRYNKMLENLYETVADLKLLETSLNKNDAIKQLRTFVPVIEAEIEKLK